jgi:hypothetical protein
VIGRPDGDAALADTVRALKECYPERWEQILVNLAVWRISVPLLPGTILPVPFQPGLYLQVINQQELDYQIEGFRGVRTDPWRKL